MTNESTSTFTVSQQFYFREIRRSIPAGATVDLTESIAKQYMDTHPGLLKPVRQTAQGAPQAVRAAKAAPKASKSAAKKASAPKADKAGSKAKDTPPAADAKTAK